MEKREKIVSLVKDLQSGNEEAFAKLYDAYFQDVSYYILRIVNDTELASDLTQETFIEIYQNIVNLKEPEAFMKWSKTIAYHKCTAHFRKRQDVLLEENEDNISVFDTLVEEREEFIPDEALNKDELKKTIQDMINSLPEEQRAAIMMRYFDEMSVRDIADIQNVSEGTVKSRLNYGRKTIKNSVEEYEKKTGVKLHCTGVIPLLLWALQGYWKSPGPAVDGAATITASIKGGATVPKAEAKTMAKMVVKEGAKTGMKSFVTKVVIGVAALAAVTGGVIVGMKKEPKQGNNLNPGIIEFAEDEEMGEIYEVYGTIFGSTLVISREPIEEYEGVKADVKSKRFPFPSNEDKDIRDIVTKAVILEDLKPYHTYWWFLDYDNLESIEGLEKLHMENVTDMNNMFAGCKALTTIEGLEEWDVSNVKDMNSVFSNCESLITVENLDNWDVSSVKDMYGAFFGCKSLITVGDLSNWDVRSATSMRHMFWECSALITVGDLSNWNVSNIEEIGEMFWECRSLTTVGDLNNWDVSNKEDLDRVFSGCTSLEKKPDWYVE